MTRSGAGPRDAGHRFDDLAGGGAALVPLLSAYAGAQDVVVLAVVPNGVPAASVVADALGVPLRALEVHRPGDADPRVEPPEGIEGRTVLVVDDGVETGTAARLAAAALREAGAARLILAVPVCPREAEATLSLMYDEVVAAVRPLVRRALTWHYRTFDTITPDEARRRIDERGAGRSGPGAGG